MRVGRAELPTEGLVQSTINGHFGFHAMNVLIYMHGVSINPAARLLLYGQKQKRAHVWYTGKKGVFQTLCLDAQINEIVMA